MLRPGLSTAIDSHITGSSAGAACPGDGGPLSTQAEPRSTAPSVDVLRTSLSSVVRSTPSRRFPYIRFSTGHSAGPALLLSPSSNRLAPSSVAYSGVCAPCGLENWLMKPTCVSAARA